MREVLICTVGTSLLGKISELTNNEAGRAVQKSNVKGLVSRLLELDPANSLCGAEVNSITSMLKSGALKSPTSLWLLLSDTQEGNQTGQILTLYYKNPRNQHRFKHVTVETVEGLSHYDPANFKSKGLLNLVRKIAFIVEREGKDRVVINATGGYKAQISFAGIIGQALGIPVYYMFESFSEIIELPPQPVSLDPRFWLENVELFYRLAEDLVPGSLPEDERFASLLDSVEVDGKNYLSLTPMGLLFHESHKHRFRLDLKAYLPRDITDPPEKKKIRYEDQNHGKHPGMSTYLKKLLKVSFVRSIHTFYYNPDLQIKPYFKVSTKDYPTQIESCYTDGKATTKFALLTTAETSLQAKAAVAFLYEHFSKVVD